MFKSMQPIEYNMNTINNLSTGPHKKFGYVSDNDWKLLKIHFKLFHAIFQKIQFKTHYTMHKNL